MLQVWMPLCMALTHLGEVGLILGYQWSSTLTDARLLSTNNIIPLSF